MAMTESFNYCQETKVSRRGQPEKRQGGCRLQLICELFRQAQWWQGLAATKKACFRQYSCVWASQNLFTTCFGGEAVVFRNLGVAELTVTV